MNKILKPFIAFALAITLVFSMSLSVFAISNDSKGSIKINKLTENATIKLYQITSLNLDTNGNVQAPIYTWNESILGNKDRDVATFFNNDDLKQYIGASNKVTDKFLALENDSIEIKSFVNQLESYIKENSIDVTEEIYNRTIDPETGEETFQESVTITDVNMGAYLVLVKGIEKIYNPILLTVYPTLDEGGSWQLQSAPFEANVKGKAPDIEKTVNKYTYEIGEEVNYNVKVTMPQYPENATERIVYIGDALSDGLDYNGNLKIYGLDSNETRLKDVNNKDVDLKSYFTSITNANFDFYYGLDNNGYAKLFKDYPNLVKLELVYSATLNEKAYDDVLNNNAIFKYSNDPYTEGSFNDIGDHEKVYTYGLELVKENAKGEKLSGATFKLSKDGADLYLKKDLDDDGKEILTENGESIYIVSKQNEQGASNSFTVNENGIIIKGLDANVEYTLTEISAPNKYILPSNPTITIQLNDEEKEDGALNSIIANGSILKDDGAIVNKDTAKNGIVTIVNYPNDLNLPTTGGMGTMIFTVGGILLMGGAVVLMVTASKKRKVNEE